MKVLMVVTSHGELGDTGLKTGLWFEELAAPYYVFKDASADITLASPAGGRPPIDPNSEQPDAQTSATERFGNDPEALDRLNHTVRLDSVDGSDFDAIFYSGGHGPLWDLVQDPHSIALIEAAIEAGRPLGLVCHAPCALINATSSDGRPVVAGRKVTGFSNSEEHASGLTGVVPFSIEDTFVEEGGNYEKAADFHSFSITDGTLVTGQNPQSSEATAQAVLDLLSR